MCFGYISEQQQQKSKDSFLKSTEDGQEDNSYVKKE